MNSFCGLRRAAVTGWVLAAALACVPPVSADAVALPDAAARHAVRPADVSAPPLPVEAFPARVEEACEIWKRLKWPTADRPRDYPVADTALVIRGGNVYGNHGGDLPAAGKYREYDVNPRVPGRHRDAERVVRDNDTHTVWYTGDHYANFREIASGCS
jgi:hypothetical protein